MDEVYTALGVIWFFIVRELVTMVPIAILRVFRVVRIRDVRKEHKKGKKKENSQPAFLTVEVFGITTSLVLI